MKPSSALTSISSILILLAIGCSRSENPVTASDNQQGVSQNVIVWAQLSSSYYDSRSGQQVTTPNIQINGVVQAKELPSFEYWKAAGKSSLIAKYNPGYISYGTWTEETPIFSLVTKLDVEVKTSSGTVSGTIALPDPVTILTANRDTVQLGQSLSITWSGSHADFYYFSASYQWRNAQGNWQYKNLDTMVVNATVVIPGSFFVSNGTFVVYGISALNGAFPAVDAKSNMTGNGSGFLYFERYLSLYQSVVVGAGFSSSLSGILMDSEEKTVSSSKKKLHEEILKRIGRP